MPPSRCYRLWMTRPGPRSRGPGRFVSFLYCSGGGSDARPPREQGAEGFVPFLYLSGGRVTHPDPGSRGRRCRPPDATACGMTRPGPESRGPGRFVSFLHCSGGGSDALPPREQGAEGFVPFLYLSGGSAARPDPGSRVAAVPLSGCYRLWMTRPGSGSGGGGAALRMLPLEGDASRPQEQGAGALCPISVFERREGDASRPGEQGGGGAALRMLPLVDDASRPREQGAEGFVPFLYLSGGRVTRPDPGSRVAAAPPSGCYRLWMTHRPAPGAGGGGAAFQMLPLVDDASRPRGRVAAGFGLCSGRRAVRFVGKRFLSIECTNWTLGNYACCGEIEHGFGKELT